MADFCYQCANGLFGAGAGYDLANITSVEDEKEGLYCVVICEGCGPIQVDNMGRCVSEDCLESGHRQTLSGVSDE